MNKPFSLGIMVGRFQTLHTGHEQMIRIGLELCREVGIFIGSSQESGTLKNPFSYEMRKSFFEAVFGDSVKVYPLPDIGVGNNATWGEYVLQETMNRFDRYPDLLISGKEERRLDWFDGIHGLSVSELYIPKAIDISASEMRSFYLDNEVDAWKQYMNPRLWGKYEELRRIMARSKDHPESASI